MKTLDLAKKNQDYVIQMRREFHMNPEVSMQEYNTCKRIKDIEALAVVEENTHNYV